MQVFFEGCAGPHQWIRQQRSTLAFFRWVTTFDMSHHQQSAVAA
jgi:hypothetical protein